MKKSYWLVLWMRPPHTSLAGGGKHSSSKASRFRANEPIFDEKQIMLNLDLSYIHVLQNILRAINFFSIVAGGKI